jgi:AcrR family transcriptional regulator
MKVPCPFTGPRPYHHGDLRRALLDAATRILDRDGQGGLSLRAVAREAGVSPAAPYHHFKDKSELMLAIAEEGFGQLSDYIRRTADMTVMPMERVAAIGLAYVEFAKAHPAVYRVMYDCSRDSDAMPDKAHNAEEGAYSLLKRAMIDMGVASPDQKTDLELACIAAWCAAHGLAEMVGFKQFDALKAEMGGEKAFLAGVLSHLGMFGQARSRA